MNSKNTAPSKKNHLILHYRPLIILMPYKLKCKGLDMDTVIQSLLYLFQENRENGTY